MSIATEFNQALMEETRTALEAIQRVRELHKQSYWYSEDRGMCNHCTYPYPCDTIKALDGGK